MPPPSKTIPVVDRDIIITSHLKHGKMIRIMKNGKIGFLPDYQPIKNRLIVQVGFKRILYPADIDYDIETGGHPKRVYKIPKEEKVKSSFVNRYASGLLPPISYDENGKEL